MSESPLDSIRRFHFDTVTHDPELLRALIEWAGAKRVLLGSDYPFDMADPDPVAGVRALGLPPADERAILAENAERLLGRTEVDADARVQAAIDNWAPRMVTQGVDYNDFVRTTARIERWEMLG